MKRFILFFCLMIFAVNSVTLTAWAYMPTSGDDAGQIEMMGEMPCPQHLLQVDEQDNTPTYKHCDGLCLCLHAALMSHVLLPDSQMLFAQNQVIDDWLMTDEIAISLYFQPSTPPPKLFS